MGFYRRTPVGIGKRLNENRGCKYEKGNVSSVVAMKVDIVGGSIGGLSTAISLKEHNQSITVVVHEKYKTIGFNPEGRRCGEAYRLQSLWKKWQPRDDIILNRIETLEGFLGEKHTVQTIEPGTYMILNRQAFIRQLADLAEHLGVEIRTTEKINSIHELEGNFIVDASGCPSTIKRELGFSRGMRGVTYQQTLEDSNAYVAGTVKIFFIGISGFIWVFPRNPLKQEINLGIGTVDGGAYNLKEYLDAFKRTQGISGVVNHVTGGLVPLGMQTPLRYRNILFVGDAGVGAFPVNGEGIYRALISGDVAGSCITRGHPEQYPRLITRMFIKWDVAGKLWQRANQVLRRIGPNAVFFSINNPLTAGAVTSLKAQV
jgi:flavin-dependent dehydrogenase